MPAPAMLKTMPLPPPPPAEEEDFVSSAPEVDMYPEPDAITRAVQGRSEDLDSAPCPQAAYVIDDAHNVESPYSSATAAVQNFASENSAQSENLSAAQPENAHFAKTLLVQRMPPHVEKQPGLVKDTFKGTGSISEANVDIIKQMVTDFAQEAVSGSPCTCVRLGNMIPAQFLLDRKLDNLSVVATGDCFEQIMTCELTSVEEIYSFSEDGESVFHSEILSALEEDARDLLVMLVLTDKVAGEAKLCLLLNTCESRDNFLIGMKILIEGKRSQICSSSLSTLGNTVRGGQHTVGPSIAARSFLRELGVRALQSVPRPPLWRTTAEVAPYLAKYGYAAFDHTNWKSFGKDADMHPVLAFRVAQHFEAARHTWYIVESRVSLGEEQRIEWLAPRRLEHLRKDLHDIVKSTLGQNAYAKSFDGARFAPHGGLPGTTAHLRRWFDALAACINSRMAPPLVLAVTFRFLEAPNSD